MGMIQKLISLIGIEVVDHQTKTPSQLLLQEVLKNTQNNSSKTAPIEVKRYSPNNNLHI